MCISLDYAKDPDFLYCVKCGHTKGDKPVVSWSTWGEWIHVECKSNNNNNNNNTNKNAKTK